MRITAMFHPIDKSKLERWAMSRGYGYTVEMNLLSQGYLVAAVEAAPGSNPASVVRDMIEAGGVRVMSRPGVVMTPEATKSILSGMGRLGEVLRVALREVAGVFAQVQAGDEAGFKKEYVAKMRSVSPGQPEGWYKSQADMAWERRRARGESSKWDAARRAGVFYTRASDPEGDKARADQRARNAKLKTCPKCGEYIHGDKCLNWHGESRRMPEVLARLGEMAPTPSEHFKLPVIGKILVRHLGEPGESEYEVLSQDSRTKTWMTNVWYKDYKRVPQLVPDEFVVKFTLKESAGRGMGRLSEFVLREEDDLWRDAIPGLERMGFGIGRPGKDGPKYYTVNPRAGEWADPKFGWPFGPEGLSALWGFVKGRSLSGWKEREVALDTIYKKQANKHLELGESAGGMGRLFEVVNPFQHGTRIRGMKRKRAGADLMLRKRSRKLRDGDYFW